jgi:hypothetical protein
MIRRIVLDTSAASRLAESEDLRGKFVSAARQQNTLCYLPRIALAELSDGDPGARDSRLRALGQLIIDLPEDSFRIACDHENLVRDEVTGPVAELPVCPDEQHDLRTLRELARADPDRVQLVVDPGISPHLETTKASFYEKDRAVSDFMKKRLGATTCCGLPLQVLEMRELLEGGIEWPGLAAPWLPSPPSIELIRSQPARYPAFSLLTHLKLRLMFANIVPAEDVCRAHQDIYGMFRSKVAGNWHDNAILTLGAYADVVLATDGDFVRRGKYLQTLEVTECQTKHLAEFLS